MSLRLVTYNIAGGLGDYESARQYAEFKKGQSINLTEDEVRENYQKLLLEKIDYLAKSNMEVLCFQETGFQGDFLNQELVKRGYKQVYTSHDESAYVLDSLYAKSLGNNLFEVKKNGNKILINNSHIGHEDNEGMKTAIARTKGNYDYFILAGDFNADRRMGAKDESWWENRENDPLKIADYVASDQNQLEKANILKGLKHQGYTAAKTYYTSANLFTGVKAQLDHVMVKKNLNILQRFVSFIFSRYYDCKTKVDIKILDSGPSAIVASYSGREKRGLRNGGRYDFTKELSDHKMVMVEIELGWPIFVPKKIKETIQRHFDHTDDKSQFIPFADKLTPKQIYELFHDHPHLVKLIPPESLSKFNELQINEIEPSLLTEDQVKALNSHQLTHLSFNNLKILIEWHGQLLTTEQIYALCFTYEQGIPIGITANFSADQLIELLKIDNQFSERLRWKINLLDSLSSYTEDSFI